MKLPAIVFIGFFMLEVDRADAVEKRDPVSCTQPYIAPAVLQRMIDDILNEAILNIEVFEIIIRIQILSGGKMKSPCTKKEENKFQKTGLHIGC
jgi:hypothetical protein